MRILLFGKNGQIGWELNRSLLPLGDIVALDRRVADFSRPETVREAVQKVQPDIIVNAAAYTAVDKAETEEQLATVINATTPGILAEEAKKLNALLVHYSTDYIFNGCKGSAYTELDMPDPVNVYGRTKLAGEVAIQEVDGQYLIFRTSWVYASRGKNFLKTIIRLMQEKGEISIVSDQYGKPTWARYVADSTSNILLKCMNSDSQIGYMHKGVFHLANQGVCSWYQFAKIIIEKFTQLIELSPPQLQAISSSEYKVAATRPEISELNTAKVEKTFALGNVRWEDAVDLCIKEIIAS